MGLGASSALERRLHQDIMVCECVQGLNGVYSGEKFGTRLGQDLTPLAQLAALKHIRNSVQILGAPEEALDGREALRQLQAFNLHGEDQTPPASCGPVCWACLLEKCLPFIFMAFSGTMG